MASRSVYQQYWALATEVAQTGAVWNVPSRASFIFFLRNDSQPVKDANGGIISPAPTIEVTINKPFAEAANQIIVLRPGDTLNEVPMSVERLYFRSQTPVEGYIRALLFQE